MKDLTLKLENRPGALAEMGEALGRAGVSVEGGGAWVVRNEGFAHFLANDARHCVGCTTSGVRYDQPDRVVGI